VLSDTNTLDGGGRCCGKKGRGDWEEGMNDAVGREKSASTEKSFDASGREIRGASNS